MREMLGCQVLDEARPFDTNRTADGTTAMPWPASASVISECGARLSRTTRGWLCDVTFVLDAYHHFEWPKSMLDAMQHLRVNVDGVIDEVTAHGWNYVDTRTFLDISSSRCSRLADRPPQLCPPQKRSSTPICIVRLPDLVRIWVKSPLDMLVTGLSRLAWFNQL